MTVCALPRLGLAVALAVAPLACASGPALTGPSAPDATTTVRRPSNQQIKDRDRALIGGLATSLALGLIGLGSLLATANFAGPKEHSTPHEMPPMIAIAGGIMSLGLLAAVPLGVAVERHRNRYPELLRARAPRPTASLSPKQTLMPASPQRPVSSR